MRSLLVVLAFSVVAQAVAAPRPFEVKDLAMLDRVADRSLSPDGRTVALQLRETDFAANKGKNSLWIVPAAGGKAPTRLHDGASSPRWSADGKWIYFLAPKNDVTQLWRIPAAGGTPIEVSALALDIGSYAISPDGNAVLFAVELFADCATDAAPIECSKKRLDKPADDKSSGKLYDRLFVRHWDTWSDGRRSQLLIASVSAQGTLGPPKLLSAGIDGDIPSKPFGDASEYAFSPDGSTVYFGVRAAGNEEAWSTNFDIHSVPSDGSAAPTNLTADNAAWDAYPAPSRDGRTLYYLAMKRPGFEADRFGIWALDLASGQKREIAPGWDRSASGLKVS
ncbi:MAG: S9 family peptidase, partial [Dokdonella sp.]